MPILTDLPQPPPSLLKQPVGPGTAPA